ncbi:MAG: hypothetical protein KKH11_01155, partial [Candidatus Omnitrophica bacterium]|nr:hypothetical protein [Candidatus Omnitrophota bacterium]
MQRVVRQDEFSKTLHILLLSNIHQEFLLQKIYADLLLPVFLDTSKDNMFMHGGKFLVRKNNKIKTSNNALHLTVTRRLSASATS